MHFNPQNEKATNSNEKDFQELQKETNKKIPRKKSVADIRPIYNCIHKHLQQTDVFQEKTKKMLCKERLELEILCSKINCINKLLRPEKPNPTNTTAISPRDASSQDSSFIPYLSSSSTIPTIGFSSAITGT
ncbi:hypothetical protein APICC_09044 [Apis cerana cerana]|uniref:Uncharacterized protein n=1 Tax=Apis cerana cerana TaxID=94128 RepID=A0A2A3EL70_APICC|nr:hypothetical protein APICC_09044 [Apis cerana cerana]